MFINRLTISLKNFDKKRREEIFIFNKISNYFEELLFNYLPSRMNIGGFGYFHVYLHPGPFAKNEIVSYGQIMEFHFREIVFDLDTFCKSSQLEQINILVDTYEKAILEVSQQIKMDKEDLIEAFTDIRGNDPLKVEQILGISRTHKSRKIRVDIVREIEPSKEQLFCRIFSKNETLKHEVLIDPAFSIYDLKYKFQKSKWETNKFIILHSNATTKFEIDVTEFLS